MTRIVSIDGRIVSEDAARVSIFDRGFLHGDAIFEILRSYDGAPFAIDEHIARLARSARLARMSLPVDEHALASEIREAMEHAGNGEFQIRVVVTRGIGAGLDLDVAHDPLRVVIIEPLRIPSREIYDQGIRAITQSRAPSSLAAAKSTNYLANIVLLHEAKQKGAREVILVDPSGDVCEGASSNIFACIGDEIVTASESAAILAGITRAHVIEVARELGLHVSERAPKKDALYAADEVFLTSTVREIVSIVRVDDCPIATSRPGPITRALHVAFRAHAQRLPFARDVATLAASWSPPSA